MSPRPGRPAWSAEDAHVDVPAADHGERVAGGKIAGPLAGGDGLLARVDEVCVDLRVLGERADTEQAVLGLQPDIHAGGDVVGHERGHADAEVHDVAVAEFLGGADGELVAGEGHGRGYAAGRKKRHAEVRGGRQGFTEGKPERRKWVFAETARVDMITQWQWPLGLAWIAALILGADRRRRDGGRSARAAGHPIVSPVRKRLCVRESLRGLTPAGTAGGAGRACGEGRRAVRVRAMRRNVLRRSGPVSRGADAPDPLRTARPGQPALRLHPEAPAHVVRAGDTACGAISRWMSRSRGAARHADALHSTRFTRSSNNRAGQARGAGAGVQSSRRQSRGVRTGWRSVGEPPSSGVWRSGRRAPRDDRASHLRPELPAPRRCRDRLPAGNRGLACGLARWAACGPRCSVAKCEQRVGSLKASTPISRALRDAVLRA